eukprot:GHVH01013769.1.p1 GENE.GHVH01013769.1~~GHVH01013769.1.p1  ORF type:complete len:986 (+),score=118.53 GHVH01013769.1:543-3500(+)
MKIAIQQDKSLSEPILGDMISPNLYLGTPICIWIELDGLFDIIGSQASSMLNEHIQYYSKQLLLSCREHVKTSATRKESPPFDLLGQSISSFLRCGIKISVQPKRITKTSGISRRGRVAARRVPRSKKVDKLMVSVDSDGSSLHSGLQTSSVDSTSRGAREGFLAEVIDVYFALKPTDYVSLFKMLNEDSLNHYFSQVDNDIPHLWSSAFRLLTELEKDDFYHPSVHSYPNMKVNYYRTSHRGFSGKSRVDHLRACVVQWRQRIWGRPWLIMEHINWCYGHAGFDAMGSASKSFATSKDDPCVWIIIGNRTSRPPMLRDHVHLLSGVALDDRLCFLPGVLAYWEYLLRLQEFGYLKLKPIDDSLVFTPAYSSDDLELYDRDPLLNPTLTLSKISLKALKCTSLVVIDDIIALTDAFGEGSEIINARVISVDSRVRSLANGTVQIVLLTLALINGHVYVFDMLSMDKVATALALKLMGVYVFGGRVTSAVKNANKAVFGDRDFQNSFKLLKKASIEHNQPWHYTNRVASLWDFIVIDPQLKLFFLEKGYASMTPGQRNAEAKGTGLQAKLYIKRSVSEIFSVMFGLKLDSTIKEESSWDFRPIRMSSVSSTAISALAILRVLERLGYATGMKQPKLWVEIWQRHTDTIIERVKQMVCVNCKGGGITNAKLYALYSTRCKNQDSDDSESDSESDFSSGEIKWKSTSMKRPYCFCCGEPTDIYCCNHADIPNPTPPEVLDRLDTICLDLKKDKDDLLKTFGIDAQWILGRIRFSLQDPYLSQSPNLRRKLIVHQSDSRMACLSQRLRLSGFDVAICPILKRSEPDHIISDMLAYLKGVVTSDDDLYGRIILMDHHLSKNAIEMKSAKSSDINIYLRFSDGQPFRFHICKWRGANLDLQLKDMVYALIFMLNADLTLPLETPERCLSCNAVPSDDKRCCQDSPHLGNSLIEVKSQITTSIDKVDKFARRSDELEQTAAKNEEAECGFNW